MAKKSKSTMKLIGLILIILGVGLAFWGYQVSSSVGSQLNQAFSGSDTEVMALYISAAISLLAGLYIIKK